jgi:[glutamine synthetase] adenylyltransferase / [glutamine synthetase]-adenylyl-L-tyrosine phosphorylase
MHRNVWHQAIATSADPARARAGFDQLAVASPRELLPAATPEHARVLAALFSGSQVLSADLFAHPQWLDEVLRPEHLAAPRDKQNLLREVNRWLEPLLATGSDQTALDRLRQFKRREMLRIATRDLARLAPTVEIIAEISHVADVCLDAVLRICHRQFTARFGTPHHLDVAQRWRPTPFCVLGLGKLGGQELNYSSDVDVMFVYEAEGFVFKEPPRNANARHGTLTSHQFFKRLAEAFIAEVTRATADGSLYRVDLRLRPEGADGPLTRSLEGCENYYAQWGQTWERMMLIKARCVAGDTTLAGEFHDMVQPFRYPRSLGERVLHEIAAMKRRIETEVVKSGELERNVKLGRGGIREIEFIAQTLQLLHAGKQPFLQGSQTLPALQKLVQYNLLETADARALADAYCFLRDVEHRLQMEVGLQTHTIPGERAAQERLARLMGCKSLKAFNTAHRTHRDAVRAIYEKFIQLEAPQAGEGALPGPFKEQEAQWKELLARHSFRDVNHSFKLAKTFVEGPGFVHVSPRTVELARQLLVKFLAMCPQKPLTRPSATLSPRCAKGEGTAKLPAYSDSLSLRTARGEGRGEGSQPIRSQGALSSKESPLPVTGGGTKPVLSDPDRVLARLDSFVQAYGTRAMLYELWTSNPALFGLLILLFDRSEFLAETAIRVPDLVDDLALSGRLQRSKTAAETLADLRHGADDKDQLLWLRRYHQAEFMRIGLRDILGLADFEQNLVELSALADACLQYALEAVMRRRKLRVTPFAIIGLGKLGGRELNYGSDLDLTFVAPAKAKQLHKLQPVAVEVMDMLSTPTELGVAFVTDARLRPDGEKGPLVSSLDGCADYYRKRAQLWELQAISRTRFVAGDKATGEKFEALASELTDFSRWQDGADLGRRRRKESLVQPGLVNQRLLTSSPTGSRGKECAPAAFTADWRTQIARMRSRIERERTPSGKDRLAIKTGAGGLMDAEFIAQILCLAHGWHEPNTLGALLHAQREGALPAADAARLIENYRRLRRVEGILRRWSYAGETVLPDDPAPLYRVAVRCGFANADAFLQAVDAWRHEIRKVYAQVMKGA